jgi:hypothetical protein
MKNVFLPLLFVFFLVACKTNSDNAIKIKGHIKNSEQDYISLNYAPRLRGNLNFDGFESIGSYINSNGNFELNSDKNTDGACYSLEFKNRGIQLILFSGDNIQLDFNISNPKNSLFVTGKGAGKINTLNLKQFGDDSFDIEKTETITEFTDRINNIISKQTSLLNAIYLRKQNDKIISQEDNKIEIHKIITDSPLTEKEYSFILNRINFQRYFLLASFLSQQSELKSLDSIKITFDSKAFKYFNIQEYKKLKNINDWHLANSLESILQIEYLKNLKEQEQIEVTYGNWQSFFKNSNYGNWVASFLKDNFNNDIYNKYYADESAWLMTLGYDYKMYYKKLNTGSRNKYIKRLNEFENLLENGLDNKDYMLNISNSNLDKSKFESLLDNFKGKSLFIVFWSAQFAGSSIINNLPLIKHFEKANNGKINIINICIDKEDYKNIWAARIIDNSWKSKHYFLPIEENDFILNKFSDKKMSSFCDGGVTYAFINKKGVVNNTIDFPFHLSTREIEKMIE